jgi:thiamine pyrophosphate-dependent acetolactate synthase large subunit-like protein
MSGLNFVRSRVFVLGSILHLATSSFRYAAGSRRRLLELEKAKVQSVADESGAQLLCRAFAHLGLNTVFGLPGSTMVPLMQALKTSKSDFVPALHEASAVAMADGYARVKGVGAVMLYMLPGTANGLGNLYNAWRDETPLLVIASQQAGASRFHQRTVGEADTVRVVEPFTRLAWEVRDRHQLGTSVDTAIKALYGPPSGPSFLAVPEDVLIASAPAGEIRPGKRMAAGPPKDISIVGERLVSAARPVVVVGGQVRRTAAVRALEQLAAELELPVFVEPFWNDRLGISPNHPCYLGPFTERSRMVREADVILAIGCRLFNEVHPLHEPWFGPGAFVAHVNADPMKLDEGSGATWTSAAQPDVFLAALGQADLGSRLDTEARKARAGRIADARSRREQRAPQPMGVAASAVAELLDDAWIVDESVSANFHLAGAMRQGRGDHFISTTGGSLGWGTGAAAGVALASGDPVICFLGDGAFFFGIHGLWPAVARNLPITYVVLDNQGFGSTRYFEQEYVKTLPSGAEAGFVGSDFRNGGPSVAALAGGFGIPTENLTGPSELRAALARRFDGVPRGPAVISVRLPFDDSPGG